MHRYKRISITILIILLTFICLFTAYHYIQGTYLERVFPQEEYIPSYDGKFAYIQLSSPKKTLCTLYISKKLMIDHTQNIYTTDMLDTDIIFNDSEYENTMYHTLKPDYLYYAGTDCNFVYFDVFTHACMALVKIYKRNCLNVKDLHEKFKTLFADEKIIRRVTDSKADAPTHIEIADFQKYILKMTEE